MVPGPPKIYTKTGDKGETGLYSGQRVGKDSLRMHAIGEVDELNACLGLCRATGVPLLMEKRLHELQRQLFDVGADLSAHLDSDVKVPRISAENVAQLEDWIDALDAELEPLQNFVLPGGSEVAARLHLARSVCRRAERAVTSLMKNEDIGDHILTYLNRLSDLLFVMARTANKAAGTDEERWTAGP